MKKFFITLLVLLWSFAALASTADDISRHVNDLIRSAEKEYFKGKTIESSGILQEAEAELIKLTSEDPGHRSLKSLQTKYDRLKTQVDKKLGNSASTVKKKSAAASSFLVCCLMAENPSYKQGVSQWNTRGFQLKILVN